jgi:fibronectin-binding autotransporter adhesin
MFFAELFDGRRQIEIGLFSEISLFCRIEFCLQNGDLPLFDKEPIRRAIIGLSIMNRIIEMQNRIVVGAIALFCLFAFVPVCLAQTSTWVFSTGSGDWFDATHWDNGIPNSAGANAEIPGGGLTAQLNQQATVGNLTFDAPRQTTLSGTGTLLFDLPGDNPATINGPQSAAGAGASATINNPIAIATGEQLAINLDSPSSLTLAGAIASTSGDVAKNGLGSLTLSAASPLWNGQLVVNSGRVNVTNNSALGTVTGDTVIDQGGILSLPNTSAEPIELNGGTLELNTRLAVTLTNPIHLMSSGAVSNASTSVGLTINSVIDGAGDVTFQNSSSVPMVIGGTNTYTGKTYIAANGKTIRATSSTAFGDSSQGTTIQSGILSLEALTNEEFIVQGGSLLLTSSVASYSHTVSLDGGTLDVSKVFATAVPVSLLNGGGTVQGGSQTVVSGKITGTGKLNLAGTIALSGNNDYTGETTIGAGSSTTVTLTSANGLGSATAGTTVGTNAQLNLNVLATEPLTANGGTVTWNNGSQLWSTPVNLKSGQLILNAANQSFNFPVVLDGNASLTAGYQSFTKWAGTVSGTGNLTVNGGLTINGSLANVGNVTFNSSSDVTTTLNSANTYTGDTLILGPTAVNNSLAFGTAMTPVSVSSATAILTLNTTVSRDINLVNGSIVLNDNANSYSKTITASQGSIEINGAPFTGNIVLNKSAPNGLVTISGLNLPGTISGTGSLSIRGIGSTFDLSGNNTYHGYTEITGTPAINSTNALGSSDEGTEIYLGTTDVNVPTNEPFLVQSEGWLRVNAQQPRLPEFSHQIFGTAVVELTTPSVYHEQVDVRQGTLQIDAATTLGKVVLHDQGKLLARSGAAVQLDDNSITMMGGTVDGSINGLSLIHKVSAIDATFQNASGFTGQVLVDRGNMTVKNVFGSAGNTGQARPVRGIIALNAKDASVSGNGGTIDADVYLNNASGLAEGGAFSSATLLGDLYLGDLGAYVGNNSTGLLLKGGIYGGNLTMPSGVGSYGQIVISTNRSAYTGQTLIRAGEFQLSDNGTLTTTSKIIVGNGGRLLLNNSATPVTNDRISDTIPIEMRGGEFRLLSNSNQSVNESVGQMTLVRGSSTIVGQQAAYSPPTGSSTLSVASLVRQPGATLFLEYQDPTAVTLGNAPVLNDGIIGGWASVDHLVGGQFATDFATYTANGLQPLSAWNQDLSKAIETDNVLITQNVTLPANVSAVNSLTMHNLSNSLTLDLAGRRLVIDTGGIIAGGNINNGELAPGNSSRELILLGASAASGTSIGANIVDGAAGSTSLTAGSGKFPIIYQLTGTNSYTGITRVNNGANLRFMSYGALPDGGDVEINGGTVEIGYQSTTVKSLHSLTLRDNGRFGEFYPGSGRVDIDTINLESGTLGDVELMGDGAITKTTDETATISTQSPTFNGTADVFDGTLVLLGSKAVGTAPINVHGGRLFLQTAVNDSNLPAVNVNLMGGDLWIDNNYTGIITVDAPSTIMGATLSSFSRIGTPGTLVGTQPLRLGGLLNMSAPNKQFSGNVTVDGHVFLRDVNALGTGSVTVAPGGILELSIPSGSFANTVVLDGGEVGTDSEIALQSVPGNLSGQVVVQSDSIIATTYLDPVNITGSIELKDGVRLNKLEEGLLTVSGTLLVGENTTFSLGPGFFRRYDTEVTATDYVSEVHLTGKIKANAPHASINFLRSGFDNFVSTASIEIAAGQSLEIRENGLTSTLVLGGGQSLVGNGTLANPIQVAGGTVAPGNSPGTLTFEQNLTLASSAVYDWQINDALGQPGQLTGWDLLSDHQQIIFNATAANPFLLKVTALDVNNLSGPIAHFDPTRPYQWLIASAMDVTGLNQGAVRIDLSNFNKVYPLIQLADFSLFTTNGNLFLKYSGQVPEPPIAILAVISALAIHLSYRRKSS